VETVASNKHTSVLICRGLVIPSRLMAKLDPVTRLSALGCSVNPCGDRCPRADLLTVGPIARIQGRTGLADILLASPLCIVRYIALVFFTVAESLRYTMASE